MVDRSRSVTWAPIAATVGLWLLAIGVSATLGSRTWADLVGLLALPVVPSVYARLAAVVSDEQPPDDAATTPDPGVEH